LIDLPNVDLRNLTAKDGSWLVACWYRTAAGGSYLFVREA